MEIFNVGPLELLLIIIIALVVLGPKEMVNTTRRIGKWVSKVVRSPYWAELMRTSKEIRDLPNKIVREAGLEDEAKEIRASLRDVNTDLNRAANLKTWEDSLHTQPPQNAPAEGTPPPAPQPQETKPDTKDDSLSE
jgi:sec-independent protein translocase protein TatB